MSAPDCGRGRSWAEMRQTLHQLRRFLSSLSARSPQSFSFRRLDNGRLRVYFLSARSGSDNQLCCVDLAPVAPVGSTGVCEDTKLPWQQLFDTPLQSPRCLPQSPCFPVSPPTSAPSGDGSLRCSRAEQLLLERKRLVGWGITEYNMHADSGRFVFTSGGSIFHVTDSDNRVSLSSPVELPSMRYHTRLNATMCPTNPDLIAYVEDGDIWVANSRTGSDDRLTFARASDETFSAGLPSYVVQEEFSRFVGFWWCPKSKDGVYRLLYEEIDESHVELVHLNTQNQGAGTESIRYPRAGANNAVSSLKMVEFCLNNTGHREGSISATPGICDVHQLVMVTPLNALFPWAEYLVRVCWLDQKFVCCQLLDRGQCRLDIVLLPTALFRQSLLLQSCDTPERQCMMTVPVQVLLSVHSEVWINVHDVFHVLPSSDPDQLSFLWLDETSGYTHLAKVSAQIVRQARPGYSIHYTRSVSKIMLTSGDWNVATSDIWVSHEHGLVFFQGNRESPVERHLYVTSYESAGAITLLTTPGFYHTAHMDQDCTALVTLVSNLSTPPICRAWRIQYLPSSSTSAAGADPPEPAVRLISAGLILEPRVYQPPPWLPQLHSISVPTAVGGGEGGQQLFCMVYPPVGWTAGRRYPTIVSVYGGPQVQVVTRAFKGYRNLRSHILAAEGYCVVTIDSRGSHNRGIRFEGHIKNRMGTVEIQDQVDALQQLSDRLGLIDLSRVAIMGWSYGGYLSLMALTQRPDIFRIAVAGAPVISWTLYDTGYTERYMDLPCRNPCGYEAGSVLSYANQFPSEPNRLLIFHGLCDENVHFFHTRQLISALIRAGKPYQLQVYPNERHSLRALESSEHFELTLLSFLNNHL